MDKEIITPREKVNNLLSTKVYSKRDLSDKLAMSRPTLDRRLRENDWGKLEIMVIHSL